MKKDLWIATVTKCSICSGKTTVPDAFGIEQPCRTCQGAGFVPGEPIPIKELAAMLNKQS
ncbi:MAG: hypothetical protein ABSB63_15970 [Spirochaetia bacterium]